MSEVEKIPCKFCDVPIVKGKGFEECTECGRISRLDSLERFVKTEKGVAYVLKVMASQMPLEWLDKVIMDRKAKVVLTSSYNQDWHVSLLDKQGKVIAHSMIGDWDADQDGYPSIQRAVMAMRLNYEKE